jgi:hypothetical protein
VKLVNGELAGKTAQSIAKEINQAALAVKKAEIGTEAWVAANKKLAAAKDLQADLQKQIKSTAAASDMLKSAWNQLPGAQFFNQIADSFGMLRGGVGGLVSQFGVLKIAIASTGIGLIVLAVTALILAFRKFTPIVDKVEQALSGISAVINELIQRVQSLGLGLWKIITGVPGGMEQVASSVDGLGESMKNAYEAGVQLKILQQDLEDAARGIEIANLKAEKSVERLIIMAKNKARSDREQIQLLNDARKIAENNFRKNEEHQKKEFDALIQEAKLASRLNEQEILQLVEGTLAQEIEYEKRGNLEDELLDRIAEAMKERIQMEGQTDKLLEKIQNAESARQEAIDADREKAIEKERKRQEQLAKLREEQLKREQTARKNLQDLNIQLIEDEETKEIEQLKLDTERKIEALVGTEEQIREQKKILKILELEGIAEIEQKYRDQRAAAEIKAAEEQAQRDKELAEEQKRIAQERADFEANLKEMEKDVALDAFQFSGELLARKVKDEQAAKVIRKTGTIAEIGLNLQRELSANAAAAALLGPIAGPPALIRSNLISIIRAGLLTARTLAFKKGGWTGSGEDDEPAGIVHKNEYVVPAPIYRHPAYRPLINKLEAARLRGYQTGGPVSPFRTANRPPVMSPAAASQGAFSDDRLNRLETAFSNYAEKVDNWAKTLKVANNVRDTEDALNVINKIRDDANV